MGLCRSSRSHTASGCRARECSSMAELQLPKLVVRVRFPSLAPLDVSSECIVELKPLGFSSGADDDLSRCSSRRAKALFCSVRTMLGKRTPRDSGGLDELARELLIEEHSVLRAEILASYGYAQSIVKWTLATFAALTAAGLVAINNATGVQDNPILINVIPVVFG